jgi:hypothetical protein
MPVHRLAAGLVAITFSAGLAAQEGPASVPAEPPVSARPTDDVIKGAVRETLASTPKSKNGQLDGRVLSGDGHKKFSRDFSEAKVPDCLHPDSLKHQPHSFVYGGWEFGVGSIYALPFWAAAVVRGKCHFLN